VQRCALTASWSTFYSAVPAKPDKTCFVISPIGDPGSPERKHSDQVMKYLISPVVEARGYVMVRADKIASPGMITHQVIEALTEAPLVVADLTDHNPNVFYELAVRHVTRKPLVQLIADGQRIPFDVADMRTIRFDIHDLDRVEQAKQDLGKHVDLIESEPDTLVRTPISAALELKSLTESEDPEARVTGEILGAIADLAAQLRSIELRVGEAPGTRRLDQIPLAGSQGIRGIRLADGQEIRLADPGIRLAERPVRLYEPAVARAEPAVVRAKPAAVRAKPARKSPSKPRKEPKAPQKNPRGARRAGTKSGQARSSREKQ
jgi:hypothetical protein